MKEVAQWKRKKKNPTDLERVHFATGSNSLGSAFFVFGSFHANTQNLFFFRNQFVFLEGEPPKLSQRKHGLGL